MTEAQRKLTEPEFAQLVTSAIVAYENNGGPYLETVHRHQAEKLGYNKEEVGQLWLDAMGRVKLARAEKSNLAKTEPKQIEPKPAPVYRRYDALVKMALPEPSAKSWIIDNHLAKRKAEEAEEADFILSATQSKVDSSPEHKPRKVPARVKRQAMVRFNPAKNPFNQNSFENARIALDLMEFDCGFDLFHQQTRHYGPTRLAWRRWI